jgi:hypothetical protein
MRAARPIRKRVCNNAHFELELELRDSPIAFIFCVTALTDLSTCAAIALADEPFAARALSVARSLALQVVAEDKILKVDEEVADTLDMGISFLLKMSKPVSTEIFPDFIIPTYFQSGIVWKKSSKEILSSKNCT